MTKNTSITLGEHFEAFIQEQLKSGRYGSASEVIRAALRAFEESEKKREQLRLLLEEGERSGFVDYDYNLLMDELDKENH
jgi:antitoxin ParD1/3/4